MKIYDIFTNIQSTSGTLDKKQILKDNMPKLNEVAKILFNEEKITGEDFRAIMDKE